MHPAIQPLAALASSPFAGRLEPKLASENNQPPLPAYRETKPYPLIPTTNYCDHFFQTLEMSDFKHKPISLEGPAFRLLRLLKGDDGPIQGELMESRLPPPEYDRDYAAISYTWGSERRPCEIWINGKKLWVTKNAYLVLRNLRCKERDRVLWIDTLCINQDDDKERGEQVQQMASIYSQAERVIIWLGEATYDTDYVMHYMKHLEIEGTKNAPNDQNFSHEQWMNIWSAVTHSLSADQKDLLIEGLQSLLRRNWFKRVWIIQEVANARVAEIACGGKSVSASIFTLTLSLLEVTPDTHCQPILDIMPGPLRNSSWWAEKRDLRTMLGKFCKSEATDPRDSIYALLGITSDACISDFLKANYEKDLRDVIFDTALFLLDLSPMNPPTSRLFDWTLPEFVGNLNSLANEVLQALISAEHEELIKPLIVRNDVDVNIVVSGQTPLAWAASRGYEEVVELLLKKGAELETRDSMYGRTPLLWAVKNGYGMVVELLLEGGANLEPLDNSSRTALSFAAQNGHKAVVELLLEKGAMLDIKDTQGRTPLSWAAQNGHKAVVELLLEKGAMLNIKDAQSRTSLSWAARNGHRAVVGLMIDKGAELESKDYAGWTQLTWAAASGSKAVVELLLEKGADIETKDNNNETPLSWAAVSGHGAVVELLIEKGAKLETKDSLGRTPLYTATVYNCKAIVELLLEKGARPAVIDNFGKTPLSRARSKGCNDVVKLLLEKGA